MSERTELEELGEFGLIEHLTKNIEHYSHRPLKALVMMPL